MLKNDKKCHFFKLFSFFCYFRCSRSIPAARKQVFKKTKNCVCGGQRTPKSIKMQKRCGFKVRLLAKKRVYLFFCFFWFSKKVKKQLFRNWLIRGKTQKVTIFWTPSKNALLRGKHETGPIESASPHYKTLFTTFLTLFWSFFTLFCIFLAVTKEYHRENDTTS